MGFVLPWQGQFSNIVDLTAVTLSDEKNLKRIVLNNDITVLLSENSPY